MRQNERDDLERTLIRKMKPMLLALIRVQIGLEEPFLFAADVKSRLRITQKQFIYWFNKAIRQIKSHTADANKPSWNVFSLINLFEFATVKELRKLGIELSVCGQVLDWLRQNLMEKKTIIYPLSAGNQVSIIIDEKNIKCHVGPGRPQNQRAIPEIAPSAIYLALDPIFRYVLKSAPREAFHVRLVDDAFRERNKVVYCFKNKRVELEEPFPDDIFDS